MTERFSYSCNSRSILPILAAAALLFPADVTGTAQAADPFYTSLMREGALADSRGDHATAAHTLRIACFGLLDEIELLAECLVRLGIAQSAIDDEAGFQQTFQRILEVEERFGSYGSADLPAELRGDFEQEVVRRIPHEILTSSPPFDSIVATDYPNDPCLRGSSLARDKKCAEAVEALRSCEQTRTDEELALIGLECLTKLKRWDEAVEFFTTIEEETRANPKISRLGSKAERIQAKMASSAGQGPTAKDRAQLEKLRSSLKRSFSADELATILTSARQLANSFPDWPEAQYLAAESAYRLAFWRESLAFFQRGGDPGDDQPRLLFFLAVSLYESGDREAAASALKRALPVLERDPFVDSYVQRILEAEKGSN